MSQKITAQLVKELRERTGVGMMECKKALQQTNGDLEQAIESLRKAGQAKAVKKGDRVATEGLVYIETSADVKQAAIVEVNCETDFVAREASFQGFVKQVAALVLEKQTDDLAAIATSLETNRLELVSKLGENITIRRLKLLQVTTGCIGAYLHGGQTSARIGALVVCDKDNPELSKDLAMQVAAMRPEFLDQAAIPAARIEQERAILMAQAQEQNADKPEQVLAKIVDGRVNKFIKEHTLLGQVFVKDSSKTIIDITKAAGITINSYIRFEVGEGLEKKDDDFASEVMSQVKGS